MEEEWGWIVSVYGVRAAGMPLALVEGREGAWEGVGRTYAPLEVSPAHTYTYTHSHTPHSPPINHRQSSIRRVTPPTASSFLLPAPAAALPPSLPPPFVCPQHESSSPRRDAALPSFRPSFPASFT